ncbi:hypothetical protein QPK32_07400 [Massilia sp. YIM B02763]|uniref:hypothetical protein n=1 Tax=Massilia sp. YIM B02763 TaxID=3050130 RepID=UPI0025B62A91|nr:hypothetical protein [Massilia sp. YIM B02763]MDN4052898.1 hypothetical protein [Massilia sp. YIM B02763]
MARAQKPTEGAIKARVLVECEYGKPNDVVEIDGSMAESLAGVVDTDPAAVAYAESLASEQ